MRTVCRETSVSVARSGEQESLTRVCRGRILMDRINRSMHWLSLAAQHDISGMTGDVAWAHTIVHACSTADFFVLP